MFRKSSVLVPLLSLVFACARAQVPAKTALAPHLFTAFGTFEKVPDGWRCKSIASAPPELLRELRIGDIITSIDSVDLAKSNAIAMLQLARTFELGLAGTAEANRGGNRLKWTSSTAPQIIASRYSLKVFHSTIPGVEPRDVITAIGTSPFTAMLGQVNNPLTALVTVELKPGKVLHLTRHGEAKELRATESTMVRLLDFDVNAAQEPAPDTLLRGLNTPDLNLSSLRGRWVLLHFWATWCKPCIRHLPDVRELSRQDGLTLAAIGFADTDDRLTEVGATEKDLKIFSPSPELQRELAIIGIPFDVLLDPKGVPVLVVSGDMPGDGLKSVVMEYIRQ